MDECSFIPYKAAVGKNKSGKISLKSPKNYAFKFSPIAPVSINYIIIFSSRSYLQFCNYYTYFPFSYDGKNQESRLEGRQKLVSTLCPQSPVPTPPPCPPFEQMYYQMRTQPPVPTLSSRIMGMGGSKCWSNLPLP